MQNDFILRMIEQFTQALIAIVFRRKAGEHEAAIEQIQAASRLFLQIDLETLLLFTPEKIADQFRDLTGCLDVERCLMCADLIYELALLGEAQGQKEPAKYLKQACLYLYTTAVAQEQQAEFPEPFEKIAHLTKELNE